eukprot:356197-Chlamydomonas_euryale.AAC.2
MIDRVKVISLVAHQGPAAAARSLRAAPSGQAASIRCPPYSTCFTSVTCASSASPKPCVNSAWHSVRSAHKYGSVDSSTRMNASRSSAAVARGVHALVAASANAWGVVGHAAAPGSATMPPSSARSQKYEDAYTRRPRGATPRHPPANEHTRVSAAPQSAPGLRLARPCCNWGGGGTMQDENVCGGKRG